MQIRTPLMGSLTTVQPAKVGDPIPEEFKALHALLYDKGNMPNGKFTPQPLIHIPEVQPVLAGGGISKPAVISMPSPNYNDRPAGTDIDTIVLHHTAGGDTAQGVGNFFKNPAAQVSAHYVVGKDGAIVQSVPDSKRSWHAGTSEFKGKSDVNDFSVGIEIVNHGDDKDPYTDKQYDALINLVAYLMDAHDVPMDRITGHKDVALPRGRKVDPSANFDWNRVRQGVEAKLNGKPTSAPKPAAPTPPAAPKPGPGGSYTVKKGDSLSKIARDVLGDLNRWREIYDLNKGVIGSNPNLIHAGTSLKMPGKAEEPQPATTPTVPAAAPAIPTVAPPAATPPVIPVAAPPIAAAPSTPVLLGVSPAAVWAQIQALTQSLNAQPLPQIAYQPLPIGSYPQATYPQVAVQTYPTYPLPTAVQVQAAPTAVTQPTYIPAPAGQWTGPMVAQTYPATPTAYATLPTAYPTQPLPIPAPNPLGVEWVG